MDHLTVTYLWRKSACTSIILHVFLCICISVRQTRPQSIFSGPTLSNLETKHESSNSDHLRTMTNTVHAVGTLPPITHHGDSDNLTTAQLIRNASTVSTVPPQPIVSSCQAFIIKFSNAAANFTKCSILHARPFRFCEHCVQEYSQAKTAFDLIIKHKSVSETGALCSDVVLNSDRIQIVRKTHEFIAGTWDQCKCDACFDHSTGKNGTEHYTMNNVTLEFLELAKQTTDCFKNYTNASLAMDMQLTPELINRTVCESCGQLYQEINKFYHHMEDKYQPSKMCMDIVDVMNSTRLLWSREFKCNPPSVDMVPVLLLSSFFCLLPIVFYSASKVHGNKVEQKLFKQKRLRDVTCLASTSSVSSER